MTRDEQILRTSCAELPEAWREFAIKLPTLVKQEHLVEIRAPHFGLTLRGTIDIKSGFDGEFITIRYGKLGSQVMTVMNERMQVEAGNAPAIVHPPDAQIEF